MFEPSLLSRLKSWYWQLFSEKTKILVYRFYRLYNYSKSPFPRNRERDQYYFWLWLVLKHDAIQWFAKVVRSWCYVKNGSHVIITRWHEPRNFSFRLTAGQNVISLFDYEDYYGAQRIDLQPINSLIIESKNQASSPIIPLRQWFLTYW